jgi:hypothetical protein
VDHYTTDTLGEEEISSDKEEVKEIDATEALKYIDKSKLRKFRREIIKIFKRLIELREKLYNIRAL